MQAMGHEFIPLEWRHVNNTNVGFATPQQSPIKTYIHKPHIPVFNSYKYFRKCCAIWLEISLKLCESGLNTIWGTLVFAYRDQENPL